MTPRFPLPVTYVYDTDSERGAQHGLGAGGAAERAKGPTVLQTQPQTRNGHRSETQHPPAQSPEQAWAEPAERFRRVDTEQGPEARSWEMLRGQVGLPGLMAQRGP